MTDEYLCNICDKILTDDDNTHNVMKEWHVRTDNEDSLKGDTTEIRAYICDECYKKLKPKKQPK